MADSSDRIEQALARIEKAAAARIAAGHALEERHARLRRSIEDAVASLDALIVDEEAEG